jgi:hypothetical protein
MLQHEASCNTPPPPLQVYGASLHALTDEQLRRLAGQVGRRAGQGLVAGGAQGQLAAVQVGCAVLLRCAALHAAWPPLH